MITYERVEDTERFPRCFIVKRDDVLLGSVAHVKGGWVAGKPNGEYVGSGFPSRETAASALATLWKP